MFDTTELRQDRHTHIVAARAILDKVEVEKRSLTAEDRQVYDKVWGEANTLKTTIDDHERRNDLEREEQASKMKQEDDEKRNEKAKGDEDTRNPNRGPMGSDEYRSAYRKFLTLPEGSHTMGPAFNDEEKRALSAGTGTEGGFLYASEQFAEGLIQNVTDATIFRMLANVLPPLATADSIGTPTLTDRMADGVWTSELGVPSTDSTLAFGKRAMTPHPIAKEIRVSKVLLRKVPGVEGIVRSELARAIAYPYENAYMTGDGVQKALGIFTPSSDGISTSRDVSTGNTATSPTFDGLKAAKYSLKQAYWGNLSWLFHRDVMLAIALLKDGNGRYLLQDSVVQGEPDTIIGHPAFMSEFAPNTMTTGLYVGMIADFKNYWIIDSLMIQIQRLEELYARNNQDLFIIRAESDGSPVREEAFARVKLG